MKNTVKQAQEKMEGFTHEFPNDLLDSMQVAEKHPINLKKEMLSNIVLCGMGGSGIGGMLAREILFDQQTIPVEYWKGYILPNYVNHKSLVVCSSYSGNTEETLALYDQAKSKNAQIIVICSGGKLHQKAEQDGVLCLKIQGGKQPRAAVGLSLVQQIHILGSLFLNEDEKTQLHSEIKTIAKDLIEGKNNFHETGKTIAQQLINKSVTLYTETAYASIATRFMQQMNENVKKKAHVAIVPEMNHNELVAFVDFTKKDAVIVVNSNCFNAQNSKRIEFMIHQLENQDATVIVVNQDKQLSKVRNFLFTIYTLDLATIELAKALGVDSEEVYVIEGLKKKIAQ